MRLLKAFSLVALPAIPVQAQQRVFVSAAHGLDSNNCSIGSPCRSFAQALSVVTVGGEVLALEATTR